MPPQRRPLDLTPQGVIKARQIGLTVKDIATLAGCSVDQLYERFPEELKIGRAKLRKSILQKQIQVAQKGNVPMLIHLGKVYCGQREEQRVKLDVQQDLRVAQMVQHVLTSYQWRELIESDEKLSDDALIAYAAENGQIADSGIPGPSACDAIPEVMPESDTSEGEASQGDN